MSTRLLCPTTTTSRNSRGTLCPVMPLIEELPVTTQRFALGWAYVPDVPPPQQPLQNRKRAATKKPAAAKGEISAKQRKAIQTKLNELCKENHKDTTIPIPAKSKERAAGKITPNVRRILTYQRTFAHYLADEEAQLAQNGNPSSLPTLPQTPTFARSGSSRASISKPTPMQPPPRPGSAKRTPAATPTQTPTSKRGRSSSTSATLTAPAPETMDLDLSSKFPRAEGSINPTDDGPSDATEPPRNEDDNDPLLTSRPHLKPPSNHLLQFLVSEPPLSYSASRAQPVEEDPNGTSIRSRLTPKPVRYFCNLCGYWGKVRCKHCGERTCGLMECWKGHDGVCTVPTY